MVISAPSWNKELGYGEGKFDFGDIHRTWQYLDYKDKLPVVWSSLAHWAWTRVKRRRDNASCYILQQESSCGKVTGISPGAQRLTR